MNEIYWITRLDAIQALLFVLSALSIIAVIVCFIRWVDKEIKNGKAKHFVISIFVSLFLMIALVLTPSTKDAFMIWGVGGTIDYIKSNETAKQLPDKCIQALDKFVDEYMLNEEDNKEE
jgi:hypothetical protein|nr:MAG TPA: hypothetical protein [Caudoviricetes sp.]DAY73314.1 MAG TPA: hypothetical protein [Caudoviricetes sp.]